MGQHVWLHQKIVYLIVTEKFQIWYGNRFSQHLSSFFYFYE